MSNTREQMRLGFAFTLAILAIVVSCQIFWSHTPYTWFGLLGWAPLFFGVGVITAELDLMQVEGKLSPKVAGLWRAFRVDMIGFSIMFFAAIYLVGWPIYLIFT